jgi:UDP-N-acetyl-D-glucosamine/UDP-N-acetyl-D-galactosamine dehydrogenase
MKKTVAIVGLGYVGLPLANALAKKGYTVLGFDISERRVKSLEAGHDWTGEVSDADLATTTMTFSTDPAILAKADIIIVAVPTPVDDKNKPDLSPVTGASHTVGKHIKKGMIVCYESTVYPGVTEDICGAILEQESGLTCGKDFFLGYSPERINPGDKEHTVDKIAKVVGGQDEKTTDTLCALYGDVTSGGIHRAPSIKVAEMAKAIENAQRDINIAYINEVAMLCHHLGIATKDVLAAAKTKWNFLNFQPGLVGGHCIGVDPYYLVEKAQQLGMDTQLITAGRSINDGMAGFVAYEILTELGDATGKKILVLGLTFKENVPDTRNSKSADVVRQLQKAGCTVVIHDAIVGKEGVEREKLEWGELTGGPYDAIVFLVPHKEYLRWPVQAWIDATKPGAVIYDLKSVLPGAELMKHGRTYLVL